MSISHLLEDFGSLTRGNPISLTDVSLEEQRLEAFEKGYQAGWDDSVKAQTDDRQRVSADFSNNLKDLSFTYQEACGAVFQSLRPFLQQLVELVLPRLAYETLGIRLIEQLQEIAEEYGPQPIEIVAATENISALEDLAGSETALPLTFTEEPSLGEGQVFMRFGSNEREIDLQQVLQGIDTAVTGFFEENRKESA